MKRKLIYISLILVAVPYLPWQLESSVARYFSGAALASLQPDGIYSMSFLQWYGFFSNAARFAEFAVYYFGVMIIGTIVGLKTGRELAATLALATTGLFIPRYLVMDSSNRADFSLLFLTVIVCLLISVWLLRSRLITSK